MTERQELCKALRQKGLTGPVRVPMCAEAADEIERLAALVQSDAKPESYGDQLRRVMKRQAMQSDAEPGHTDLMVSPESIDAFMEANPLPKQSDAESVGGLAKARAIALEQRCERGTPWDLACVTIANKIEEAERLAEDAEPVGIDAKRLAREIWLNQANLDRRMSEHELERLIETYTAPPRPDASAGLIEASILLDNRADEYTGYNEKIEQGYRMAAKYLRTRAADRNGK